MELQEFRLKITLIRLSRKVNKVAQRTEPQCRIEHQTDDVRPRDDLSCSAENQASQVVSINKSGTAAEMRFTSQEVC